MSKNKFVFAVCGSKEHIDTLNYVLPFLKHFSKSEILVVTDLSRNESVINHNQIIDVATPKQYNNHQAAIYLKTGLYRFLDMKHRYCYLDTDIIAISQQINEIFTHYTQPITFCTDHCKMQFFSPYAINIPINCKIKIGNKTLNQVLDHYRAVEKKQFEKKQSQIEQIKKLEQAFYHLPINKKELQYNQLTTWERKRINYTQYIKDFIAAGASKKLYLFIANNLLYFLFSLLHFLLLNFKQLFPQELGEKIYTRINKKHRLSHLINQYHQARKVNWFDIRRFNDFFRVRGFIYNAASTQWKDIKGNLIFEENFIANKIQETTNLQWNRFLKDWIDEAGNVVGLLKSNNLAQQIKETFQVEVKEKNWQHWNGGVFLFDKQSIDFLSTWHEWSIAIFNHPNWATRDQGTLIAAAWEFNLQKHPTLPITYNFLADYNHPTMVYLGDFKFFIGKKHQNIGPCLLHIYHHFGDNSWDLWRDVESLKVRLTVSSLQ